MAMLARAAIPAIAALGSNPIAAGVRLAQFAVISGSAAYAALFGYGWYRNGHPAGAIDVTAPGWSISEPAPAPAPQPKIPGGSGPLPGPLVADILRAKGFSGENLITALAVTRAESGWKPKVTNTNLDGSIDRGLWQINSKYHPHVSPATAFDPNKATAYAWELSKQGRNFTPWAAYNNNSYRLHLDEARKAAGQDPYAVRGQ